MGFANSLPLSADPNLASSCAGSIFDQSNFMTICDTDKGRQVARHPHLVNSQNCSRAISYSLGNLLRINVVSPWNDIHEHRSGTTIPDGVGRCDE